MSNYTIPKAVDFDNMSQKARASIDWSKGIKQPKIDGCACRIDVTGKIKVAVSATNKVVKSIDHILDALPEGHYTLCGEVYDPLKAFQEISGDFRRGSNSPNLRFMVFDGCVPGEGELGYTKRMENLRRGIRVGDWIPSWPVDSFESAWDYAKELKKFAATRFDGAIWRNPDAPFECGRSKGDIIKLKPLLSFDVECVGFEAAVGEKTGRETVALVVSFRGTKQKVATGLSHEQQASPAQFVGQIIEVEVMGLTLDNNFREPRFKGVRDDKLSAD
jgi:ATP-dependent DNA ligase